MGRQKEPEKYIIEEIIVLELTTQRGNGVRTEKQKKKKKGNYGSQQRTIQRRENSGCFIQLTVYHTQGLAKQRNNGGIVYWNCKSFCQISRML